jgi:hypothetical protein
VTEPEEVPVHDGPDPHDWPDAAPKMWGLVLDIEYLNRIIEVLDGRVPDDAEAEHAEARSFLNESREAQRAVLSQMILHAYRVALPDLATEAVGGFRGDGNGPGDRDQL